MLKLFGKQPVEYPNARDFERRKYTRFELVQPRKNQPSPEVSQLLVHTIADDEHDNIQTLYQPETPEIRPAALPASAPESSFAESEISPSILRAALPMRFARIDASRNLPSIHDVFNSETD